MVRVVSFVEVLVRMEVLVQVELLVADARALTERVGLPVLVKVRVGLSVWVKEE